MVRSGLAVCLIAVITVVLYMVWLGWDQDNDPVPGVRSNGYPYETWQMIGLVLTLAALAAVVTYRRMGLIAAVVIPTVLTIVWSIDAATDVAPDANMWGIGAVFIAVYAFTGIGIVCALTVAVRHIAATYLKVHPQP